MNNSFKIKRLTIEWVIYLPILLFVCFTINSIYAQELYDKNWVFRSYWRNAMIMQFGSDSIRNIVNENSDIGLYATNTSMSDIDGNLLFYSNGCSIWNSKHQVIQNGDHLNSGPLTNEFCSQGGGYLAGHQSMISIPKPANSNQYYIFHVSVVYVYEPIFNINTKYLYYTLVDFTNPAGKVVISKDTNNILTLQKNRVLLQDTSVFTGEMTAIKHANNKYWWIITPKNNDSTYIRFLVTDTGILGPYYQTIGGPFTPLGGLGGGTCFSPDGKKFVRFNVYDGLYVFDCDRETGLLSNYKKAYVDEPTRIGGIAISPNSKYAYASSYTKLYQIDLDAKELSKSIILIDTFNWVPSPTIPFYNFFGMSQLGPDCRIYITSYNGVDRLHVIKYPDRQGKACELVQQGYSLPSPHGGSLPHFPNYRLGTSPACDSTIRFQTGFWNDLFIDPALLLYPNQTKDYLNIETSDGNHISSIEIIDLSGKMVKINQHGTSGHLKLHFDVLPGCYIIKIYLDNNKMLFRKLIIEE